MKINLQLLGKIIGSALLGLEDATQALSNPATEAADIQDFVSGMVKIWVSTPTTPATTAAMLQTATQSAGAPAEPVPSTVAGHVEPQIISALRR